MNTTQTTYKGVTTKINDLLFEPIETIKNKPRKSNKFPIEIQVVYYSYKWFQDTFYIDKEFKDFLLQFSF